MIEPGTEPDEPVTGLPVSTSRALHRISVASVACLVGVAALGLAVREHLPPFDVRLHAEALRHRGGWVLTFARVVTHGGSTAAVWPIVVIAALIFPRRTGARRLVPTAVVAAAGAAAVGAGLLLNRVLARPRPPRVDWAAPAGGNSFPSGHTTAATIAAGLLAWAICRHVRSRRARTAIWVAAVAYAATVGWSRVWLGVHWPLDVLGGWLFGTGWLLAVAAVVLRTGRAAASVT